MIINEVLAMSKVLISNIQRFSTKDGPGIRTTVFFKGCPLRCRWCHNPETHTSHEEIMYNGENCVLCGRCVTACERGAVSVADEKIVTDRDMCTFCGKCADVCYYNAREICGKYYSPEEIFAVIERDRSFYSESGGGATFSGGECMMYPDFLSETLKLCKGEKIHTAVDTSGYAPWESFEKILPFTDLFLYDIKAYSSKLHEELTGVPNELIFDNLEKLSASGARIFLRLPLIEGCNAEYDDIAAIAEKTKHLNIDGVNLLPYHDMGKYKYTKLGRNYDDETMGTPSDEKLESFKKIFESRGFKNVKIGG